MTAETAEAAPPGRQVDLGKHFWALGVGLVTLLVGAWLMIAPFALGYQPYGAGWADGTIVDFWFGLGVVLVSLAGLALFALALVGDLRAAGVVRPRPKPQPAPAAPAAPAAAPPSDDLERTLATLAAALAADLAERRGPEGARPAPPPAAPAPPRDHHDLRAGAIMFRQPADQGDTTPQKESWPRRES
ncbi:MAG TPA: hypothetical protein VFW96_06915 [Thermomicrobiales bacterium]|nr:hypothetical protein [Thermomicrobiales bacterium]